MAVLVLLNGVPGSGKSALARAWADEHAAGMPLALDIDVLRSMLGGWRTSLPQAGISARRIALAAIGAHLDNQRDVIVPQYVKRSHFIDDLHRCADEHEASFVEIALRIDAEVAAARLAERATRLSESDPHGALAASMAEVVGEFEDFMRRRPHVERLNDGPRMLERLTTAIVSGQQGMS